MALDSLTDLDTAMLDLEQEWWLTAGKKKDAIHDLVGMTRLATINGSHACAHRGSGRVRPGKIHRLGRLSSAKPRERSRLIP